MPSELPPILVVEVWSTVRVTLQSWELWRCFNEATFDTPAEELLQVGEVTLDRIG